MLTISISDSLAGNPEGLSEWTGDSYMAGLHSYEPYTPWASHEDPRQPWQVPQTRHGLGLPTGALTTPPRPVPCSTWASPLRVPLPDPINEKPFCEDTLDLPPHLSSIADQFSDLDPSWPQESQYYPPPGLAAEQPLACPEVEKKTPLDVDLPPGIKIFVYNGPELPPTRVEWRIDDLNGKLQASMGRPLVSPPFAALALPNLRLMVFPDGREQMKNARSSERKGLYTQMIKKGPLHGALKLKADCLQCATVMTVNLLVGEVRAGPLVYDFSEQAIHGLDDFGIDWLKQVDRFNGSLTVGIEILAVRPQH